MSESFTFKGENFISKSSNFKHLIKDEWVLSTPAQYLLVIWVFILLFLLISLLLKLYQPLYHLRFPPGSSQKMERRTKKCTETDERKTVVHKNGEMRSMRISLS